MTGFFSKMTITTDKIGRLKDLITSAKHIVITAHKSPDGDSVGSSLGLYHYIKKINSSVFVCHPDPAPHFLHWMPGFDQIETLEQHPQQIAHHFKNADLIFCLDYNSAGRIGKMESFMTEATATKVMIDHHRDPDENYCDLLFSDITACSTSQLVYEIIEASGNVDLVDENVGTPLYSGIVTDTGSFRFSSTQPKTHLIAADLLKRGVIHWQVHENIFDNNSLDRIKLTSYAMLEKLEVLKEYSTAYIALSQEDLSRFSANKGDTEGLVNQALAIEGTKVAVFFKEVDGIIKISLRSKGSIPVNDIAKNHFHGGGHLNAAGGKHTGSLDAAIQKFVTILPTFVEENKDHFK